MATEDLRQVRLRRHHAKPGEVEEFVIATHCDACAIEIAESEAGPEGGDA